VVSPCPASGIASAEIKKPGSARLSSPHAFICGFLFRAPAMIGLFTSLRSYCVRATL
jgi:hypothetical protein